MEKKIDVWRKKVAQISGFADILGHCDVSLMDTPHGRVKITTNLHGYREGYDRWLELPKTHPLVSVMHKFIDLRWAVYDMCEALTRTKANGGRWR